MRLGVGIPQTDIGAEAKIVAEATAHQCRCGRCGLGILLGVAGGIGLCVLLARIMVNALDFLPGTGGIASLPRQPARRR